MGEYSTLGISNDFMFGKILEDPVLCKPFLELILGIQIHHIDILERQKGIDEKINAHSIRLDIYVDDGKTIYNCEMQTANRKDLHMRSRYYQGQIDMNLLGHSETYSKLKKCYIIFICTFDPFNKGRYIYTFENLCDEDTSVALNDGALKVFINTKGSVGDVSDEFRELMHFLDTSEIKEYHTELINDLAEALTDARTNEKWEHDFMSIEMLKNLCREEGREEGRVQGREEGRVQGREEGRVQGREEGRVQGREEGRVQGREEGRILLALQRKENALRMLRKGFEASIVAECVDMPLSEVQLLAASL